MLEKLIAQEYLGTIGCALFVLIITLLCIGVGYMYHIYNYWVVRGVPGPKPTWIIGNIYVRVRATLSMAEFDRRLYEEYGGKKYCGFFEFNRPCLMVGDPDLLKHIMIKDFDHFTDRR